MDAFQWFIWQVLEQTVMRPTRRGLAGGMAALVLAAAAMAFAQDDAALSETRAPPTEAADAQPAASSDLLGPGEEGIGPLAGAQPTEPAVEASADEPGSSVAAAPPKAGPAKPRQSAPARSARRTKAHPQG